MLISLSTAAYATALQELDQLLDPQTAREIFDSFPEEISYVEGKYGISINGLDSYTNDLIKEETVAHYHDPSYDFVGLMTALSVAKARYSNARSAAQNSMGRVRDHERLVEYRAFGPLSGKVFQQVPTGATEETLISGSIRIAKETEKFGVTIEATATASIRYTLTGPADGATLENGRVATHRLGCGILYGTIMRYTYQEYDPWTGTGQAYTEYIIQDAIGIEHTMLAAIGTRVYVEKQNRSDTMYFSNYKEFEDEFEENPGDFI